MLVEEIDPQLQLTLIGYFPPQDGRPILCSSNPIASLDGLVAYTTISRPFVTLTYAQSLDARISAKPGVQTKILGPKTKSMTHYIRSKHDAIMVGAGTVRADDPKLNCRYPGGNSPRPVVLDPRALWTYSGSQLRKIHELGQGLAPFIIADTSANIGQAERDILEQNGGKYIQLPIYNNTDNTDLNRNQVVWTSILQRLHQEGILSVMIEGGAKIINDLLEIRRLVDSVIITIGPVFLGKDGVEVAPAVGLELLEVSWWHGGGDSVVCGRINSIQEQ